MNTQHTPGPWNRCQYGYLFAMVPGEAFGHTALVSRQICNVQQTENPADIRLIAAAPDMLAALRQAYDGLRDGLALPFTNDDHYWPKRAAITAALDAVRVVIDNVDGREDRA